MSTKESVLMMLENKKGMACSGEDIAGNLKISRAAVWKAVKELLKDGHKISAGTNRGYILEPESDIISAQGIAANLPAGFETGKIFVYGSVASTNTTAKEMAVAGAEHGTVVIAETQTGGRGRFGRSFYAPAGCGLYLSVILRPEKMDAASLELATVYAAVNVCKAIEAVCGKKTGIKWVNDIFYEGKKICGILCEGAADLESRSLQWIVMGAGINLKEPPGGYPDELKDIVTALYAKNETTPARNKLAAALIKEVLTSNASQADLIEEYKSRLVMLGKTVEVKGRGGDISYVATAKDVNEKGNLIVRKENGETEELFSGEISVKI
ncbi:MAG: biotin--[acetyl-CoA-carboxylase] ligase [Clostridiales bacterium]|nr:biotin--[acetyl-CoA-carboxylase] ligase [Clostridiales bacterium]